MAHIFLIQHAEHEVQKSMLENIRVSYEVGDLNGGGLCIIIRSYSNQ